MRWRNECSLGEEGQEGKCVVLADSAPQLRVAERALELVEELVGRDQLELACEPAPDQLRRSAGGGTRTAALDKSTFFDTFRVVDTRRCAVRKLFDSTTAPVVTSCGRCGEICDVECRGSVACRERAVRELVWLGMRF
jgi:hypothetical protein